jgi:hypothetical protein
VSPLMQSLASGPNDSNSGVEPDKGDFHPTPALTLGTFIHVMQINRGGSGPGPVAELIEILQWLFPATGQGTPSTASVQRPNLHKVWSMAEEFRAGNFRTGNSDRPLTGKLLDSRKLVMAEGGDLAIYTNQPIRATVRKALLLGYLIGNLYRSG